MLAELAQLAGVNAGTICSKTMAMAKVHQHFVAPWWMDVSPRETPHRELGPRAENGRRTVADSLEHRHPADGPAWSGPKQAQQASREANR